MTADDLPAFPEIPLSPESRLRWLAWGRECMAKGMERAAGICENLNPSNKAVLTSVIEFDCAAAIRSELPRNQEG